MHELFSQETPLIEQQEARKGHLDEPKSNIIKRLGPLSICFIAFFNVSGGPWGTENIVSSLGPFPGLVGIFIMSVLWALPMILVTSEMSSRFPADGGYSIWVAEAFGEFWGFQESFWSWVSGVVDNAIYPVLAFESLNAVFRIESKYMLKFVFAVLFSLPNFFAYESFGKGLILLFLFVMFPFFLFALDAFSHPVDISNIWRTNADSFSHFWKGFTELVPVLYWNFSGFDCVSTYAGEVNCPERSYITALSVSLLLVVFSYVIVLAAAIVASKPDDWLGWTEGSLTSLVDARMSGFIGIWVVLSSIAANFAMHASELFEDSWQLAGMADAGLAPRIFAYRSSRYRTPVVSLFFSLLIICVLITLDFRQILVVNNFFSILSSLLEILAFLSIRLRRKSSRKNYFKVPIESFRILLLVMSMPLLLGSLILLSSLFDSILVFFIDLVALVSGFLFYLILRGTGSLNYRNIIEHEEV